jgi:hypothetical protein
MDRRFEVVRLGLRAEGALLVVGESVDPECRYWITEDELLALDGGEEALEAWKAGDDSTFEAHFAMLEALEWSLGETCVR